MIGSFGANNWSLDYHSTDVNRGRFPIRALVAVVLLISLSLVMIHWHQEGAGQDCGLCAAQHMPGLQSATQSITALPQVLEWRHSTEAPSPEFTAFLPAHPGRAPPSFSSL